MTASYIDVSYLRNNLATVLNQVFTIGKTFVITKNKLPVAQLSVTKEEKIKDPWDEALGGWSKFMTQKEADDLIKEIYELRKDGSSKKKTLWEQP